MHRIILIIILVFCSSSSWSSKFSLDKFDIEINSNFLGEEIVLFGHKDEGRDLMKNKNWIEFLVFLEFSLPQNIHLMKFF
jgi:hypothetical protein